jgi:hypothetical protein
MNDNDTNNSIVFECGHSYHSNCIQVSNNLNNTSNSMCQICYKSNNTSSNSNKKIIKSSENSSTSTSINKFNLYNKIESDLKINNTILEIKPNINENSNLILDYNEDYFDFKKRNFLALPSKPSLKKEIDDFEELLF